MRRIFAMLVLSLAGCSTAPVADFLDFVAPGGPRGGSRSAREVDPPVAPLPPADFLPPPRDNVPPLPPVPAGSSPAGNLDNEGAPSARLQPKPADN